MNDKSNMHMSILLLISLCDTACAMEKLLCDRVRLSLTEMRDYTTATNFDRQYNARTCQTMSEDMIVSFPVDSCHQLPICSYGKIRWFETSSVMINKKIEGGRNIEIIKPFITNVLAVRAGNNVQGVKSEIYFGYNGNNPQSSDKKGDIYKGVLLYIKNNGKLNSRYIIPHAASDVSLRLSQSCGRCFLDVKEAGSQKSSLQEISLEIFNSMYFLPLVCYWPVMKSQIISIEYKGKK